MTETHIREFLSQYSVDELINKGVLRGNTRLLNNNSVSRLIEFMAEQDVSRLVAPERDWFLTSQRDFQNPLSTEAKRGRVDDLANQGNVFNQQNTSINPHFAGGTGPELDNQDESDELRFGLERDLQRALRANIEQLEPGLKVLDGGVERSIEGGRIDITAEDSEGCLVVIELKAGRAELAAIGQLLSYMGSVANDLNRPIRGIIVANDFHPRLVLAARAVADITLMAYSFQFSFTEE